MEEVNSCPSLQDHIGKPVDSGPISHIDPDRRMIGMHLYDGIFKVVPMTTKGQLREAFNIRLEELMVIDWVRLCARRRAHPRAHPPGPDALPMQMH
jgi:hypothetical protein